MRARTPGRIGLGNDLIANVVYTGTGDKPKLKAHRCDVLRKVRSAVKLWLRAPGGSAVEAWCSDERQEHLYARASPGSKVAGCGRKNIGSRISGKLLSQFPARRRAPRNTRVSGNRERRSARCPRRREAR